MIAGPMNTIADIAVADSDIAAFRADGVVVLCGPFADWVETLRAGVARNIEAPGPDARVYDGSPGKGRHFGDYCNWDRIPEFRRFIFESPAARIAARLMGSRTVRLFHEHVLVKEPDSDVPTPWHHDQPYYSVDGAQTCSLWIPLDRVPRETVPEFVAGSHRWGKWFRPDRFNKPRSTPTTASSRCRTSRATAISTASSAGPWSRATPSPSTTSRSHGAPANRQAGNRRRAFCLRLVGDDARWAVRPGVTSPPFRGVKLAHGAVMDAPEFPLLIQSG